MWVNLFVTVRKTTKGQKNNSIQLVVSATQYVCVCVLTQQSRTVLAFSKLLFKSLDRPLFISRLCGSRPGDLNEGLVREKERAFNNNLFIGTLLSCL